MLPVIAEDYTPPLGVVIIIDCSGSMSDVLENAKAGARACLNAMTERDYCGVIALDDDYKEALALTPVTREYEIVAAIDNIGNGGGTLLTPSLKRAGDSLKAQTNIEKRHIIVVSDCMVFRQRRKIRFRPSIEFRGGYHDFRSSASIRARTAKRRAEKSSSSATAAATTTAKKKRRSGRASIITPLREKIFRPSCARI